VDGKWQSWSFCLTDACSRLRLPRAPGMPLNQVRIPLFPEVLITDALGSPARPRARFLCAHGAGAGPQTPFLDAIADLLAARGVGTHRFAFGYMQARTAGGTRRPPPKAERLTGEYRAAAAGMPPGAPILIGGKSMGGRVASLIADELYGKGSIVGLV